MRGKDSQGIGFSKQTVFPKDACEDDLLGDVIETAEYIIKNCDGFPRINSTGYGLPRMLESFQRHLLMLSPISAFDRR
jgi:hypothetical protein